MERADFHMFSGLWGSQRCPWPNTCSFICFLLFNNLYSGFILVRNCLLLRNVYFGWEVHGLLRGGGRLVVQHASVSTCSWLFTSMLGRVMWLLTACPLWPSFHRQITIWACCAQLCSQGHHVVWILNTFPSICRGWQHTVSMPLE